MNNIDILSIVKERVKEILQDESPMVSGNVYHKVKSATSLWQIVEAVVVQGNILTEGEILDMLSDIIDELA